MIKKLICLIWGHVRTRDYFTVEYGKEPYINPITLIPVAVPIVVRKNLSKCSRCGVRLN